MLFFSNPITYLWKQKQQLLQHRDLMFIKDVSTQWNFSYQMVEQSLILQQSVCANCLDIQYIEPQR